MLLVLYGSYGLDWSDTKIRAEYPHLTNTLLHQNQRPLANDPELPDVQVKTVIASLHASRPTSTERFILVTSLTAMLVGLDELSQTRMVAIERPTPPTSPTKIVAVTTRLSREGEAPTIISATLEVCGVRHRRTPSGSLFAHRRTLSNSDLIPETPGPAPLPPEAHAFLGTWNQTNAEK